MLARDREMKDEVLGPMKLTCATCGYETEKAVAAGLRCPRCGAALLRPNSCSGGCRTCPLHKECSE